MKAILRCHDRIGTGIAPIVRLVALLVLLGIGSEAAASQQPTSRDAAAFFTVEPAHVGLHGEARTVVQGTEIETFSVEILGIMRGLGPSGDLILIRASGDVIERTGGIAAGMSGSPVYIDNRLIGAIGFGYDMADHRIGLVTPIGDMLDVMDLLPEAGIEERSAPGDDALEEDAAPEGDASEETVPGGIAATRQAVLAPTWEEAQTWAAVSGPDTMVLAPLQTPLMVSGMGERALRRLDQDLSGYNLVPIASGGAPGGVEAAPFAPGSAFGVQLVRGDLNMTSIGTVTYVEDDRFIGFGHPFLSRGVVDYFTTSAYVHHTVQSLRFPFKLGAPLDPVGVLSQDRGAAVGGRLGDEPATVNVRVQVRDLDLDRERTTEVEVVRDELLTTTLAATSALAAMDKSIDRIGPGTSRVLFRIDGEGLPRSLVRDNVYFSEFDIAALSLFELMEGLRLISGNRFEQVDLMSVRLVVEIGEARMTARVEDVDAGPIEVYPGDTVEVEVVIRPYRDRPQRKVVELPVPADARPGTMSVVVRGGGWGLRPPVSEDADPEELDPVELEDGAADLDKLIEEFMRREKNNEIVVEFFPMLDERPAEPAETPSDDEVDEDLPEDDPPIREEDEQASVTEEPGNDNGRWRFDPPEQVKASISTDYVIVGSTTFDLTILPPPSPPEPPPDLERDVQEPDPDSLNDSPAGEPGQAGDDGSDGDPQDDGSSPGEQSDNDDNESNGDHADNEDDEDHVGDDGGSE